VVEQGGQVAVTGLGRDPIDPGAVDGGGGGVPGTQRVAADAEVTETGTLRQPSIKGLRTDVLASEVTWDDEIAACFPGPTATRM